MNLRPQALASGLLSSLLMRWVGALVGAVIATGCLLPQDDQLLPDPPIPVNSPPFLPPVGELSPDYRGAVNVGDNCKTQEFRILVDDPDKKDDLRVRCFLDPTSTPSSGTLFEGVRKPANVDPPVVASCTLPVSNSVGLGVPGAHFVKMVVADGELHGEVAQTRPWPLPDGGILQISTFAISYLWPVTSQSQPCLDGGL